MIENNLRQLNELKFIFILPEPEDWFLLNKI